MRWKKPDKVYVKSGDTVVVKLGASECMMSMGLTGKFMPVEILKEDGFGQLRNPETGGNFSMPNPLGWMDFYKDDTGWYSYDVWETGVGHTVTHTNGRFYVYVENKQLYGVQSLRFEEMRDAAREMHSRDIPSAEVRFVENSRFLNNIAWSRSVVVPLDTEVRSHSGRNGLGEYRDTYLDVPTHFNLFAGRYFRKEANA
ncbi:hypothetical protein [Streptomyces malaysiensis]|uniref:Uncharacterized protein n=1 Tax=Streptomyces malaysiensis TaxID=92644 RepID=A0A7X6AZ59_STRMQ|nr:hypothetical protein [Streptomyces malaysiensis]NIY68094.1 hypothetical protein [Streptomyces malaysiensis]